MTGSFPLDMDRDFTPIMQMKPRAADIEEFMAALGLTSWEDNYPIIDAIAISNQVWVYYHLGSLVMVGGVVDGGVIWAVGTDTVPLVIKALSEDVGRLLDAWLSVYGKLEGFIYKKNINHIRWLARFGFVFTESPRPDFLYFYKEEERNHVSPRSSSGCYDGDDSRSNCIPD